MAPDPTVSGTPNIPEPAEVRSALEKLTASPHFAQSERLCRFLTFVVDLTLEGRASELKESVIGVAVYDRDPGYDPKTDPIVRVEARRLRAKLQHYYEEGEGRHVAIRIDLPKGGYVPQIVVIPQPEVIPEAVVPTPPAVPVATRRIGWAWLLLLLPLFGIAGYFWMRASRPSVWSSQPITVYAGIESRPALSPSGDRVAFLWTEPDFEAQQVYVQPVGASSPRRLTHVPSPHYSPVWSADGREILYVRLLGAGQFAIYSTPAGGGTEKQILEFRGEAHFMGTAPKIDLSADGQTIAFYERTDPQQPTTLYLFDRRSGTRREIMKSPPTVFGDHEPTFSPDGRQLAFVRSFSNGVDDLYILTLADKSVRRVTSDRRAIIGVTWAADAKSLIMAASARGVPNTLWRVPASGGAPQRMLGVNGPVAHPSVSRDGKRLAYDVTLVNTNIWIGDLAAGTSRKLLASTVSDSSPQFSPDGDRVAFRSDRTGTDEIWICNRDGRNPVRLTYFNGSTVGSPRWSPDGKWIAFDTRAKGNPDIYVISANGGTPRQLTTEPLNDVVPSWSRDGKWIYFSSNRSGTWQIWKQSATGGVAVQVTRDGGFNAAESPDGRALYYFKSRTGKELWRMPTEGGADTKVTDSLQAGLWGSWCLGQEGAYLISASSQAPASPEISLLPWGQAMPRKLLAIDKLPPPGDAGCSVDPKAHAILYTQRDSANSDLFLIDNFR